MAKSFNVVQKEKRARRAERKRAIHGDPTTRKLKNKSHQLSISGKRKRKLLKKWRRDQKGVIEKGLVTMEDVEMAAADAEGTSQAASSSQDANKAPTKFHMKKNLKLRRLKQKGKHKSSKPAAEASVDAMVE